MSAFGGIEKLPPPICFATGDDIYASSCDHGGSPLSLNSAHWKKEQLPTHLVSRTVSEQTRHTLLVLANYLHDTSTCTVPIAKPESEFLSEAKGRECTSEVRASKFRGIFPFLDEDKKGGKYFEARSTYSVLLDPCTTSQYGGHPTPTLRGKLRMKTVSIVSIGDVNSFIASNWMRINDLSWMYAMLPLFLHLAMHS